MAKPKRNSKKLYIALISVHGLVRAGQLELGRDADTGGQIKYVVELAHALAQLPQVGRVDLLTRRIVDSEVSADYGRSTEKITANAQIIRLEAGPEPYLRKEELWDHLDNFADNALEYFRQQGETPDIIHSHYADAGYVGVRLASLLGVPLVHTGHSLGRVKRRRLLASGESADTIEHKYNMQRRIEAEEEVLGVADLVIASTRNEIDEQYGLYDHYNPGHMAIIPPGTDLQHFLPPQGDEHQGTVYAELKRFLRQPDKPIILALSRPDERKNIRTLVMAYGESPDLQKAANLVVILGNREDIQDMESGPRDVMAELLMLIDQYDLYGKVAYPKHHQPDEVPEYYRLAAASHGVFVNPALTEPFGLTLIEAAASGLPIVATEDGGPQDIIRHCNNGCLIDPLDQESMAKVLLKVLGDMRLWQKMQQSGLKGVQQHYSWEAHAARYLESIHPLLQRKGPPAPLPSARRPLLYSDRAIFTDLDQSLLGDPVSLAAFIQVVRDNRKCATFGIATGRRLESALKIMRRHGIPQPDVLITSVGTEIYYAPELTADTAWSNHIDHLWQPEKIRRVLATIPGLKLQVRAEQSRFKLSYYIDPELAPTLPEINSILHQAELTVNTYLSFGQFLDVVPVRASKGFALRYFADRWGIPLEHILAAGGSGTDEDMIRGNTLGVVVANRHEEELSHLADADNIYFAHKSYASGILEAIDHYDFYGACRVQPPGVVNQ